MGITLHLRNMECKNQNENIVHNYVCSLTLTNCPGLTLIKKETFA